MMTDAKIDRLSTPWLLQRVATLERHVAVLLHENARLLVENEALKKRVMQENKQVVNQ